MLIEQIKKDRIQAMKGKDKIKATALATLLGEIETEVKRGVVLDDSLVVAKITKTIKGIDETLKLEPKATALLNEKAILSIYLPQMMSESEIEYIIDSYIDNVGMTSLGDIMKYFKANYSGKYDPKLVKELWEKNNAS